MEVAHDKLLVKSYITQKLYLLNSYHTWHGEVTNFIILLTVTSVLVLGSKNIAESMKMCGSKKTERKSWFMELPEIYFMQVSNLHVHTHIKYKSLSLLLHEELSQVSNKA